MAPQPREGLALAADARARQIDVAGASRSVRMSHGCRPLLMRSPIWIAQLRDGPGGRNSRRCQHRGCAVSPSAPAIAVVEPVESVGRRAEAGGGFPPDSTGFTSLPSLAACRLERWVDSARNPGRVCPGTVNDFHRNRHCWRWRTGCRRSRSWSGVGGGETERQDGREDAVCLNIQSSR